MAIRTTEIRRLPVSLRAYDKHADRQGWISYMAICPECNERNYICVKVEDIDLDRLYLKVGE